MSAKHLIPFYAWGLRMICHELCAVMENIRVYTGYMSMDNLIMQISSQKPRNEVNWMTINKIVSRHDSKVLHHRLFSAVDRRDFCCCPREIIFRVNRFGCNKLIFNCFLWCWNSVLHYTFYIEVWAELCPEISTRSNFMLMWQKFHVVLCLGQHVRTLRAAYSTFSLSIFPPENTQCCIISNTCFPCFMWAEDSVDVILKPDCVRSSIYDIFHTFMVLKSVHSSFWGSSLSLMCGVSKKWPEAMFSMANGQ